MWVALALLTAVCTALRDAAAKHATRWADPVVVAFGVSAIPAVGLGVIVLAGDPALPGPGFLLALLVSGGINAVATPLVFYALHRSDMSLVAPLTSLTPLFMIGSAWLVLGERPSSAGVVGVGVIVLGAYLLNASKHRASLLAPFAALLRDPGARAMLIVAFLYSFSAAYDKVGTRASSPLLWGAALSAVVTVALAPLTVRRVIAARARARAARDPAVRVAGAREPSEDRGADRSVRFIVLAGALAAAALAAQMTALLLTLAAYVIAVKRMSTLFGVLIGHSVFREQHVRQRLLGAAVMLAGFVLLTLG